MSCPDCFTGGVMTDYQPKGTTETLHNLQTYISQPSNSPNGIIIIIPDAFGMQFPNNKHLADVYASRGYLTYLPDFMDGVPAPAWMTDTLSQLMAPGGVWTWLTKPYYLIWTLVGFIPFKIRHSYPKTMPKVQSFFESVRNAYPLLPIGAAGFCWGGQHTVSLASGLKMPDGRPYTEAHFTAHPSNLNFPTDIQNVTQPLSIAVPEKDFVFTVDQAHKSEAILREKEGKDGPKHWEIKYYPGASHGFSVRTDVGNKDGLKQADEAIEQAINFFDKIFSEWRATQAQ